MRHVNFFLGAQNGVFWVGAKKVYVERVYVLFRSPIPEGPKIEKNQDLEIFQARLKISSERPTKPLFCGGELWRSGLIFLSEIVIFKRD